MPHLHQRFALALFIGAAAASGCKTYEPDRRLQADVRVCEFGVARERLLSKSTTDPSDRDFLLDRMKLAILSLADGIPEAGEPEIDAVYDILRTQGLNANKTVSSVLLTESGVRFWKGEPFEQALAFSYVSLFDASRGEWGNSRAAAMNSIFYLRDFSKEKGAGNATMTDVVSGKVKAPEEASADTDKNSATPYSGSYSRSNEESDFAKYYRPVESDFALGYFLVGLSSWMLSEKQMAEENFEKAVALRPAIGDVVEAIQSDKYNAVFFVEYGMGPTKYGTGPDNAIAEYRSTTQSGPERLEVIVGGKSAEFPEICDLNTMATNLRWRNLEDARVAKSQLGTALMVGGATAAIASQNDTVKIIGLIATALGGLMKATAAADTRHCEILPQRVYVAPVMIPSSDAKVVIGVAGYESSHVTLTGIAPPKKGNVLVRFLRLPDVNQSPAWATSGEIFYSNDATGEVAGDQLPYILGGSCVRRPTQEVLASYHRSGNLKDVSLEDLESLYWAEGIHIIAEGEIAKVGRHVLEGGRYLYTPTPGTIGFARVFGMPHAPYSPRSAKLKAFLAAGSPESRAAVLHPPVPQPSGAPIPTPK